MRIVQAQLFVSCRVCCVNNITTWSISSSSDAVYTTDKKWHNMCSNSRYARCWWYFTLHIINVEKNVSRLLFHFTPLICVCIPWVWLGWRWCGCVLMYCSSFRNFTFCFYWFLFYFRLVVYICVVKCFSFTVFVSMFVCLLICFVVLFRFFYSIFCIYL